MSMKNASDTIGNRTSDLPACSAVPQPTAPPLVVPPLKMIQIIFHVTRKRAGHRSELRSWLTELSNVNVNFGLVFGFTFRVGLGCTADVSDKQTCAAQGQCFPPKRRASQPTVT